MHSLTIVMNGCAELWGAVIRQAARDVRMAATVIPDKPRPEERALVFRIRRNRAQSDKYWGHQAQSWFKSRDFRFICGLCGADPENVRDLLRREGFQV